MLSLLMLLLPAAFAAPDWCKWVPDGSLQHVDECSGYSHTGLNQAQGCASWCEWVPALSWYATPQCQGCQGLFHNQTNQTMINSTNFTSDKCANWCQHVSRPAWQYTPDCADCHQDLSTGARPSQSKVATQPAAFAVSSAGSKSATGGPDWCKWVPYGSLQYVPACSAGWGTYYHGAICASWCVWVPAPSWIYTPDCQRCSSLGSGHITGCESWCTWVSRPAWQNTPECTQCTDEQKDENTTRIMLP